MLAGVTLEALRHASDALEHGRAQLTLAGAGELLAEDLRQAQQSLGEITGAFSSDDLLGRIFSSFCIGGRRRALWKTYPQRSFALPVVGHRAQKGTLFAPVAPASIVTP